ncbi:MAG TPA: lasso peptide biosynthesis B2 protein [Pyrinomonadaceae bacterium]
MVALQTTIESSANFDSGSILLSADGRLLKLNAVGSHIWKVLDANPHQRLTVADIITRLEVSSALPDPIRDEVGSFVQQLAIRDLLNRSIDVNNEPTFATRPDVMWSGRQRSLAQPKTTTKPHYFNSSRLQTFQAVFWLFAYSLVVKVKGFAGIRRLLQLTTGTTISGWNQHCEQVCSTMDRAQRYLFQQALCLQRSVVIARLLRQRGVAAELVIGAHLMPFKSHAWVEVNRRVVNDSQNVQRYYEIIIQRF